MPLEAFEHAIDQGKARANAIEARAARRAESIDPVEHALYKLGVALKDVRAAIVTIADRLDAREVANELYRLETEEWFPMVADAWEREDALKEK